MAYKKLRLDSAGMAAMLRSGEVAAAVHAAGAAVAGAVYADVGGEPIDVETRTRSTTGLDQRPAFDVSLAHPAGMAVEAKRGPLAKAAASVGLEVRQGPASDLLDYITKSGKKRKATQAQIDNWTRGSR